MKFTCCLLAFLWPLLWCFGQSPTFITPLSIGDTVPDLMIRNISGFSSTSAKFSSFGDKAIVLDFWEIGCTSCIKILPRLDSLQKHYADQLQIVTVTRHASVEQIQSTLQRIKSTKNISLPIVTKDDQLHNYFPYELISHLVWIGKDRIVKAITGSEYVSASHMREFINGETLSWELKSDVLAFNYDTPLLSPGNKTTLPVYYSALTEEIQGINSIKNKTISGNTRQLNFFNYTLLQLARLAAENADGAINPKMLEITDPKLADSMVKKTLYCYTITIPVSMSKEEEKIFIRKDLGHWLASLFNLQLIQTVKPVNCLALRRLNAKPVRLNSKGGQRICELEKGYPVVFQNAELGNLVVFLNTDVDGLPWVVDETGFQESVMVDMVLPDDSFKSLPTLRKSLKYYGLDLVPVRRNRITYILSATH